MRTTLKQTLAGAWMLLATLALATAGCSQLEDAPTPPVATGNEPISISIAPKPAFEAGDAATRNADADAATRNADAEAQTRSTEADTRSTVDGNGTFAWAAGDKVYVILTFSFADGTTADKVMEQLWVKANNTDNSTANNGWTVYTGWNANTANDTPLTANDMTWPLGAKTCKVQAFHTNCGHTVGTDGLTNFTYADGQGDHMIFTKNDFAVGDDLAIAFEHQTTRITFTGLKAGAVYRLKHANSGIALYNDFKKSTFNYGTTTAQSFTAKADGTFTRCMPLTSFINASTGAVELTIYASDNATSLSKGTLQAQGSVGSWVTNDYRYTMKVSDFTGDTTPGNRPDLLPPAPIQPGATVHEINGYYVTQPHATAAQPYAWGLTNEANEMETDPCKSKGNWRMPTMKDFEVMAGWSVNNPWIDTADPLSLVALPNPATFKTVFPAPSETYYWSLDSKSGMVYAWSIQIKDNTARYDLRQKISKALVRCVQSVKPVTP